eukprot:GHVR01157252.1.p1 GENE.GHVR01157252.1~~GHVR01157252.1.p1  ORF type:complete len:209 (-),score=68.24 GHVR01157252.1:475-1101(-)
MNTHTTSFFIFPTDVPHTHTHTHKRIQSNKVSITKGMLREAALSTSKQQTPSIRSVDSSSVIDTPPPMRSQRLTPYTCNGCVTPLPSPNTTTRSRRNSRSTQNIKDSYRMNRRHTINTPKYPRRNSLGTLKTVYSPTSVCSPRRTSLHSLELLRSLRTRRPSSCGNFLRKMLTSLMSEDPDHRPPCASVMKQISIASQENGTYVSDSD